MAHDVFLSYSHRDTSLAERLERELGKRDLSVYRDKTGLLGGDGFPPALEHALESSRNVVFLISSASLRSKSVEEEQTMPSFWLTEVNTDQDSSL